VIPANTNVFFCTQSTHFSALNGMPTQTSDENGVCLTNLCIVTKRKKDLSRFSYHTKDHLA